MQEMGARPGGCHIGSIFGRPTPMFPDHENPSNIAPAAATAPGNSEASTPEEAAPPVAEQAESTDGAPANLAPAPAMATEVSLSQKAAAAANGAEAPGELAAAEAGRAEESAAAEEEAAGSEEMRSEEHTSELQSRLHLVCRLLLEKKKKTTSKTFTDT